MFRNLIKVFAIDTKVDGALDAFARNPLPFIISAVAALSPALYNWASDLYNNNPAVAAFMVAGGALVGMLAQNLTYSVRKVLHDLLDADTVLEQAYREGDDLGAPDFEEE